MYSNPDSDHLSHVDCDPDSNPDSGPGAHVNAALVPRPSSLSSNISEAEKKEETLRERKVCYVQCVA